MVKQSKQAEVIKTVLRFFPTKNRPNERILFLPKATSGTPAGTPTGTPAVTPTLWSFYFELRKKFRSHPQKSWSGRK
jgi:hypothetical protein